MNIRDDTLVCGYCGEKIPQKSQKQSDSAGKRNPSSGSATQKGAVPAKLPPDEGEAGEEEEEGGLSPYLQPGEQVLIGSLNVSVKKFFFHAYMTDRRIFLIDTQEKKLKVTAKDVPRNTIAGSISEFSENSDPVLVLSIRSADDDIKTMKIVFVQNGMDRSAEIDEWISLLHKEDEPPARPKRPVAEEPAEPEPEEAPVQTRTPVKSQELRPTKKPVKDLEKQPPVKRLISFTKAPEEEPQREAQPVSPPRRTQVRQVTESVKKVPVVTDTEREVPQVSRDNVPPVKKPEVQSAMKVAMKSAMKPLAQPPVRPAKREISEHVMRRPVVEPEQREAAEPPRRPKIHEPPVQEEPAEVPQFCHNCGKKLPLEANFCPGCGTRLGQNRTLTSTRFSSTPHEKRSVQADTVTPDRRPVSPPHQEEPDEDEIEDEKPQPTKPPVKKAPKGSEMTILHKFLRR
jgi:hypothetical protein